MTRAGLGVGLGLALLSGCTSCDEPPPDDTSITPLTERWQQVIPFQETPAGIPSIRASDCGTCHRAIYEEWRSTTHAVALQDLQFQSEWRKDGQLWLCLNCHTPLANQLERVVTGLYDGDYRRPVAEVNPRFDRELQQESITCATCHVRDGAIIGPGLGGNPPHPVRTDPEVLSLQICVGCHNVSTRLSDTLVCNFSTGDEWSESPARRDGLDCIDCHMPTIERPVAVGGPVRTSHQHLWPGSGIAKFPDDAPAVRAAYRPGYELELVARRAQTGEGLPVVAIELAITNSRAGHSLPTGDVERFITLSVSLQAAAGDGPAGSALWTHEERIGERWEWHPRARQLSDNSLRPRERRVLRFEAPLEEPPDGDLFVEVVARNHRMTEENAREAHIYGRYPLSVETMRTRVAVTTEDAPDPG